MKGAQYFPSLYPASRVFFCASSNASRLDNPLAMPS